MPTGASADGAGPATTEPLVRVGDPAVGQVAISAALLVSVSAMSAVAGRRRGGGKRGAAHARTAGRQAESGDDAFPGPGQPNAPGAHHNVKVIPVKDKAKVIPAKGKHAKKDPKQAGNPN
jgi:hypothetical protein